MHLAFSLFLLQLGAMARRRPFTREEVLLAALALVGLLLTFHELAKAHGVPALSLPT